MKKQLQFTLVLVSLLTLNAFTISAKNFTMVKAGLWSDVNIWANGEKPANHIETGDIVTINNHLTINADLTISGVLLIEKTFSAISIKRVLINEGGQLINDGNTHFGSIANNGTIVNTGNIESQKEFENRGTMTNDRNMVVGTSILNQGGKLEGNQGTYFANGSYINSLKSKVSQNVKMLVAENKVMENSSTKTAMHIDVQPIQNNVMLAVINPKNEVASSFEIERSFDGNKFEKITNIHAQQDNYSMIYQDKNLKSDLVFYKITAIAGENKIELPQVFIRIDNSKACR